MGDKEWKPNPSIRERVLGEILQTEKDYVKDLQVIINVCCELILETALN